MKIEHFAADVSRQTLHTLCKRYHFRLPEGAVEECVKLVTAPKQLNAILQGLKLADDLLASGIVACKDTASPCRTTRGSVKEKR